MAGVDSSASVPGIGGRRMQRIIGGIVVEEAVSGSAFGGGALRRSASWTYSISTTATVGIAPLRFSSSPSLRSSNAFPVVDLRGHRWESPGRSGGVVEAGGGAAHVQRSAAEPA